MSDALQLGGNIELSGFREIDPASMVIIKKIVGNYARKFSDHFDGFEIGLFYILVKSGFTNFPNMIW